MEQHVKVRIRFKPEATLPAGETMWATPVRAHDGGGAYELRNTSFYVPLAARDVVRAEVDGDGVLQVTDVVCPGPFVMSWSICRVPEDAATIGDRWLQEGANWSEGTSGMLATVWNEGVERRQVQRVLDLDRLRGRLTWALAIDPDERVAGAQESIEFARDDEQHFPPAETSYWAADDPFWRTVGLDSPEFYAYLQSLAGEDPLIAAALEQGDHAGVREILAFINGGPLW